MLDHDHDHSSSPTAMRDKLDELESADGPPSNLDDVEEQRQALLSGHGHANDADDGEKEKSQGQPRPHSTLARDFSIKRAVWILMLLALAIAAAEIWLSPWRNTHVETGSVDSDQLVPDYILDPAWDFSATPMRREYSWTIQDRALNPDGVWRPMMVINGQFPGPLIECNEGDTLVINVDNQAVNATSIHWHGLFQNGTNWMDGTVGITQCPIAPNSLFTYEFKVERQSGTYYYHAHQGVQASDGVVGPLIVHSKDEKDLQQLEYTSDRVVMVQDHYHDLSDVLMMEYLHPDRENEEPVPDGALINGMNTRDCDKLANRDCDNSTSQRPLFQLEPGHSHRLRFINTGAFAEFQIQIDEHEFAVTEVDGTDVVPAYFHRLNISPGQRYSIILDANMTQRSSYWLRARMVTHCFKRENPNLEPEIRAIVRYTSSPLSPESSMIQNDFPASNDWSDPIEVICRDMNTSLLHPVSVQPAPPPTSFFYLRANFEIGNWRLSRGFFNTSSWRADVHSPILHRTIDGLSSGNASFFPPPSPSASNSSLPSPLSTLLSSAFVNDQAFDMSQNLVLQTTGLQTLDLAIQSFDDGNHPFHLHGHKFYVLAAGHGHFDADATYPTLNLSNPLRRDTATVEGYGWLLLRVVADNPGVWALHCHVSWHAEAGLLMVLATRTEVVSGWEVPEENLGLCAREGLERGGRPDDAIWEGNMPGDD